MSAFDALAPLGEVLTAEQEAKVLRPDVPGAVATRVGITRRGVFVVLVALLVDPKPADYRMVRDCSKQERDAIVALGDKKVIALIGAAGMNVLYHVTEHYV